MVIDKDAIFLSRRIKELADRALKRDVFTHTSFLNLNEQAVFFSIKDLPKVNYKLIGGYEAAERKVVCFFPVVFEFENDFEQLSDINQKIFDYIYIKPVNEKFSDRLTHRDYLGALMNLGIDRCMTGDIVMSGGSAYVVVLKRISRIIADNLETVKKTKVAVSIENCFDTAISDTGYIKRINVISIRIDALISAVFNLSRGNAVRYVDAEKVFVNSRCIISHSYVLKSEDIVSIRGLGRFKYIGEESVTKKGRLMVSVKCYV